MSKTACLDQLEGAALQGKAYTEAACAAITQAVAGELSKRPTREQVNEAVNAAITGAMEASY